MCVDHYVLSTPHSPFFSPLFVNILPRDRNSKTNFLISTHTTSTSPLIPDHFEHYSTNPLVVNLYERNAGGMATSQSKHPLPHMMPGAQEQRVGLSNDAMTIIVPCILS